MTEHRSPTRWLRTCRPAWALLLSGVAACAGAPQPHGVVPREAACVLVAPPPANANGRPEAVPGTGGWAAPAGPGSPALVVGLPGGDPADGVDPAHAPVPRDEAERMVFAQMYQTLVAVDCRGETRPSLAVSWQVADQGRRWTFHLRPDARAWNGAVVGAADVARGLAAAGVGTMRTVAVVDDRTLALDLSAPVTAAFFARPALAVALADSAGGWPMGTGPYRPAPAPAFGPTGDVRLVSASGGVVEFRTGAGDPRNALDAGVDLLVTRDPATLDYAAATGGYRSVPLPWARVYLLLVPGDRWQGPVVAPTDEELEALARDAVRVQARPASFRSADAASCFPPANPVGPDTVVVWPDTVVMRRDAVVAERTDTAAEPGSLPAGERQIVYPLEDATAAALAQRLVALGRAGDAPRWAPTAGPQRSLVARGLPPEAFEDALARGEATAFLFPVRRTATATPCDLVAGVERRAPWARASELVPLVETRATVLVRDGMAGMVGVTVDGAGTLRLGPVAATGPRP